MIPKPDYLVVSGERDAGKTTFLREMAKKVLGKGKRVGGFLSLPFPGSGKEGGYEIYDLVHRRYYPYARRRPGNTGENRGFRYHLNEEVFGDIRSGLKDHFQRDLLLIDEFGPLERSGGGFAPLMEDIIHCYRGQVVVSVRPVLFPDLLQFLEQRIASHCRKSVTVLRVSKATPR